MDFIESLYKDILRLHDYQKSLNKLKQYENEVKKYNKYLIH